MKLFLLFPPILCSPLFGANSPVLLNPLLYLSSILLGFTMKNLDVDEDKGIFLLLFLLLSSVDLILHLLFFSPQFWRRTSFPISLTQMAKPNTLTLLSVTFILTTLALSLFLLCSSTNSKYLDLRKCKPLF